MTEAHKKDLYTARWFSKKLQDQKSLPEALKLAAELEIFLTASLDEPTKIKPIEVDTEPPESKSGSEPKEYTYEMPQIKVSDINVTPRGTYQTPSGKAKGLVVHYTAGRWDKGEKSALGTLRYLADRGLGCLVMDTEGVIHQPKNQDIMTQWDSHAGSSSWKGQTSLSRFLIGMEITNAGKLNSKGVAWFGQQVPEDQIRKVNSFDNISGGLYHAYTAAQEKALIDFCLWQLDVNPEFDIDWVVGHDEISKSGKVDPGGSLSMSMPEFRAMLRKISGK